MAREQRHMNFWVPAAWVERIDELAGPRGRSEWLRGAVRRALIQAGGLPIVRQGAEPDPRQTVLPELRSPGPRRRRDER